MLDLRPLGYVIGLLLAALGIAMLGPLVADLRAGNGHWPAFLQSGIITSMTGVLMALASSNGVKQGLTLRQSFLLTTGVWVILPVFGALPFILGITDMRLVDAYFEAMSGMTTTGATVIIGLDVLPEGLNLWRGILHWLGGLGIVIVAMLFLPVMRIGGMQFFQAEGFDTLGKVLPRAMDIAQGLLNIYLILTGLAFLGFLVTGMSPFDAVVHAFSAISTGGFSTRDMSFSDFPGAPQYVAIVVMLLGSVPFVRLLQLMRGDAKPILRDSQVRTYLMLNALAALMIVFYRMLAQDDFSEQTFREALFNVVSYFSGTGFVAGDVTSWGGFSFVILICVGAIGGCTSSTGCSIKIFRYQVLFRSIWAQIQQLHSANRVVRIKLDGRLVDDSVLSSVILLFSLYIIIFGVLIVGLSMTGLSFMASVTGAWTAIFNVGPAFGPEVASTGALGGFPDSAKWLMILGMLMGRLEIIAVVVLILPRFWRA